VPVSNPQIVIAVIPYALVTFKLNVTLVTVVALSTLNLRVLPAAIAVVQPVRVLSWLLVAAEIVGGALAVMLSASVGGKLA